MQKMADGLLLKHAILLSLALDARQEQCVADLELLHNLFDLCRAHLLLMALLCDEAEPFTMVE
jgi:hypothetical protein